MIMAIRFLSGKKLFLLSYLSATTKVMVVSVLDLVIILSNLEL